MKRFFESTKLAGRRSWCLRVIFGPGAGYIGGRTFYLAWNSGSRHWSNKFRGTSITTLQMGLTKNANKVPYIYH